MKSSIQDENIDPNASTRSQGSKSIPSSPTKRTLRRTGKLKRSPQRQTHHARQQSITRPPSIASTTSSLSDAKNFFSSWVGNLKAGVSGAWTKAKGEYDTYLATQEGETRMQKRRKEIFSLHEPITVNTMSSKASLDAQDSSIPTKRPSTSDGSSHPAAKKRTIAGTTKKLKKQTSLGKLAFRKSSTSYPVSAPKPVAILTASARSSLVVPVEEVPKALGAPVYRGTANVLPEITGDENELQKKVQSLEMEVTELRAKVRWFEESYGEIPADTMAEIQHSLCTVKKPRRSVFIEELDTTTDQTTDFNMADQSILPKEVKELKGFEKDAIIGIPEEDSLPSPEIDNPDLAFSPETTIKLIQPSPSMKSIASPPRPAPRSASPDKRDVSPPSSPSNDIDKTIDLLETLSPIHPNIMPALIPRKTQSDAGGRKLQVAK